LRLPESLLALDDFAADDLGFASPTGVLRQSPRTSLTDGVPVRALVDVPAWERGIFEEVGDHKPPVPNEDWT